MINLHDTLRKLEGELVSMETEHALYGRKTTITKRQLARAKAKIEAMRQTMEKAAQLGAQAVSIMDEA